MSSSDLVSISEFSRTDLFADTVSRLMEPVADFLRPAGSDDTSPPVSEIMINGHETIYIERAGRLELTDRKFKDEAALYAAARAIAQFSGKLLTPETQSVEARLPDKSRVHIVQAPAARNGLSIAIRRFQKANMSAEGLIELGSIAPDVANFLKVCSALRKNIVVSGGTSTGKTTFLNAITEYMDDDERIVVIEDVNELAVHPRHVLYFEAQKPDRYGKGGITIRELFQASLRMRPDRILVGECRGGEALDMIQAMTSGHSGSITTLHANTALDALQRLETMALMSDIALPQKPLRHQISQAVDIIVQLERLPTTRQRGIVQVSEVLGVDDDGSFVLADIFEKSEAVYSRKDPSERTPLTKKTEKKVTFAHDAKLFCEVHGIKGLGDLWS